VSDAPIAMPTCPDCDRYWTPSSMTPAGACPACGRDLALPADSAERAERSRGEVETPEVHDDGDDKVPWHFKLTIVALVVYLGWRFVELGIDIFT
jgi:hypothetical protein